MAVKETAGNRRVGDGTPGPGRPKGQPNKATMGVLELCAQRWPGFSFEDYGDPAGEQRSAISDDGGPS